MNNSKGKMSLFALLAVICTVISFGAFSISKVNANETFDFNTVKIQMIDGASVRYYSESTTAKESGIRFSSAIYLNCLIL